MKIICSGVPKTGSKSLAQALRTLGYKVYHFDDQFLHFGQEWYDLYYHDKVPDFYLMFNDVDVVMGTPSYFFFEELMEAFPAAKVIHSERDEHAWARSIKRQIDKRRGLYLTKVHWLLPTYNLFHHVMNRHLNVCLGIDFYDLNATYIWRKRYRWHNDRVKAVVPADKLLVFRVEEGWKPLCEFTGKKIPNDPFPHLNDAGHSIMDFFLTETGEFGRKIARELMFVKMCLVFLVIAAMILVYAFIL